MIDITSTVVTVIALVLGLTVVALQLSSTQFSPRLLRNFLRDRPNQVVLSTFVATFVYTAAGLYTVGVLGGTRTEDFPRLAVSGSLLLMFVSLAMVVYYADHLAHSVQVDAIAKRVEVSTLKVVKGYLGGVEAVTPTPPPWAVSLPAPASGYLQTVHPDLLLRQASHYHVHIRLRVRVGEHIVAGTVLGWMWASRRMLPCPTRLCSPTRSTRPCASGSNEPRSRTPRSVSGNWSTWHARRCLRRSMTPTPRSRPSTICRSSSARWRSVRSATTSPATRAVAESSSCPPAVSATIWRPCAA